MPDATLHVPGLDGPGAFGKYEVIRRLAKGGMAEIYLAASSGTEVGVRGFQRLCVVKRMLPELVSDTDAVQSFLREARLAASLHHSNIAQVFDLGELDGCPYFVMELLRGADLRQLFARAVVLQQPIPFAHIIAIASDTCAGLHYAHELHDARGAPLSVVHRDVTPHNVFVTHEGRAKVCDFGIAKSAAQETNTVVGDIKGKLRYMSPEQAQAEPLDRRSDVYSVCVVFWELITLRRLRTGKTDLEVFSEIIDHTPDRPSSLRADVPKELDAILWKGLAKDRADRFQTAEELGLALDEWARASRNDPSPTRLSAYLHELFDAPQLTVEQFLDETVVDPFTANLRLPTEAPAERPKKRRPVALYVGATALVVGVAALLSRAPAPTTAPTIAEPPPVAPAPPTPRPTPVAVPVPVARATSPHVVTHAAKHAPSLPAPPKKKRSDELLP